MENTNGNEETKIKKSGSIKEAIVLAIKGSSEQIVKSVIEELADVEIQVRKNLVIKAMNKLDELEKEGKKLKPDNISYNEDGTIATSTWTKGALDAVKKNRESIAKIENSIEKALSQNDYEGLKSIQ